MNERADRYPEHDRVQERAGAMQAESTSTLVMRLAESVPELFRKEFQLFRAEMNEKTTQLFTALGLLIGGLVLALVALNVLAAALVEALTEVGLEPGWAALIVGGVLAIVALLLVSAGMSSLRAAKLAPDRTINEVQKDAAMAREAAR